MLVDLIAAYQMMSFLDAFLGYKKNLMHLGNHEKTSFMIERWIYCYKVMPFGLKNVGATYQFLINKMLNEQIGKTMEVYIYDMLVKFLRVED